MNRSSAHCRDGSEREREREAGGGTSPTHNPAERKREAEATLTSDGLAQCACGQRGVGGVAPLFAVWKKTSLTVGWVVHPLPPGEEILPSSQLTCSLLERSCIVFR